MPRKKTVLDDNIMGYTPLRHCPDCNTSDPHARARHQLELARTNGLDGVRSHLTEQYIALRDGEAQRPDLVHDVCAWMANLMEQFSHMADPATGAPLSWWEARAYMSRHTDSIARAAYQRAPEHTRFAVHAPDVEGFTRVRRARSLPPQATPFPDEPTYVDDTVRVLELDECDYLPDFGD